MAVTEWGLNHPLARKHWSNELNVEALKQTWFLRFLGTDTNSLVQIKEDTQKAAGDRITVGLRMQLEGDGIQGDGTLEGNEENLVFYSDNLTINQLRHAVRSAGRMSEQRVPYSIRAEARDGLADWFAARWDTWFFNQLAGNTAQSDTRYTGNQATIAPSSNRRFAYDDSADGVHSAFAESSLSESDTFKLKLIDWAQEIAKTTSPAIRPIKYKGGEYFVCFLHPYQVTSLRLDAGENEWRDIQNNLLQGGDINDNPIFSGAIGIYNNTIFHESTRVPQGVTSGAADANTRRAVFCGAQAACLALGQGDQAGKMSWEEEFFDYGNQLGVAAGCIAGLKKLQFNSEDFGTIVISTYATSATGI